jgi:hypothetical protein
MEAKLGIITSIRNNVQSIALLKTPRLKCTGAVGTVGRDLPEKPMLWRVSAAARGPAFALDIGSIDRFERRCGRLQPLALPQPAGLRDGAHHLQDM